MGEVRKLQPSGGRRPSRKRKRRRSRRYGRVLFGVLSFLIMASAIFAAITVFFKITEITVLGETRYDKTLIRETSGIEVGENMFTINKFKAIDRLFANMVYLDEITIRRKLPNEIQITVSECEPAAALETADGYWLMDRKGKLLEKVPLSQTAGITLARGVEVAEPKPGLVIGQSENEKIQPMFDLIALLSDKDMLSDVGVIDLSKLYDIQFTYLDRFTVKLGSAEQTDRKLRFLNEVVKRLNESDRGTIDVSEVKTARFIKEE